MAFTFLQKKMKEYCETHGAELDGNLQEDALTYALGSERQGRVRGLGFGATPTTVALQEHNRLKNARLERDLHSLQRQVDELKKLFLKKMKTSEVNYLLKIPKHRFLHLNDLQIKI